MKKMLKITVEGQDAIPVADLEPFQGELKHLEKAEYERLRNGLIEYGFSFVIHVWSNKGKNYVIDGHQRLFVVKQMAEVEGWTIPNLPVARVKAANFGEAKRKVLAAASQYGKMTQESLMEYMRAAEIPYDEIVANFHFPEVNFSEMAAQFVAPSADVPVLPHPDEEDGDGEKTLKSGSEQVRQLQLFFNGPDYAEFIEKLEAVKPLYKRETVTDTLLEIVREIYSAEHPQD